MKHCPPKLYMQVENWVLMTRFGTRYIPTQFVLQFLSFPISTVEKCFCRILTTFVGLDTTGACKVEYRAQMTQFFTRNIPILLMTFPGPGATGVGKIENQTRMTQLCT